VSAVQTKRQLLLLLLSAVVAVLFFVAAVLPLPFALAATTTADFTAL
jgi:hypothetical protein